MTRTDVNPESAQKSASIPELSLAEKTKLLQEEILAGYKKIQEKTNRQMDYAMTADEQAIARQARMILNSRRSEKRHLDIQSGSAARKHGVPVPPGIAFSDLDRGSRKAYFVNAEKTQNQIDNALNPANQYELEKSGPTV